MSSFSQVGIGTTTPDASSVLDITATDKGVLIPRVSLANVTTTMLDGTNTAATGLLIYNTNASVTDGNGVGYYYFNGTIWEHIKTSSSVSDHDFYEEGTTSSPDDINDDKYTLGNLAIGKNIANYALDIEEEIDSISLNVKMVNNSNLNNYGMYLENSSSGTGYHFGQYVKVGGSGVNALYASYNRIDNDESGSHYGTYNRLTSDGIGRNYGVFNSLAGSSDGNQYGNYQLLKQNGDGVHYGAFNDVYGNGNGNQYGVFNRLGSTGTGDKYGVSNLLGSGRGVYYGVHNLIHGGGVIGNTNVSSKYGLYNEFDNTTLTMDGDLYGVYNSFDPTINGFGYSKYGVYTSIPVTIPGINYGIYCDVPRFDSYAGYFLGRVSIGTATTNNYILPISRGTANQVMQTDAAGNLTWVDSTAVSTDNQNISGSGLSGTSLTIGIEDGTSETVDLSSLQDNDWYEEGTTNSPSNINDDIFTYGNVGIGTSTPASSLDILETNNQRALNVSVTGNASGFTYGVYTQNENTNSSTNYGVYTSSIMDTNAPKVGVHSELRSSMSSSITGFSNSLSGTGIGLKVANWNSIYDSNGRLIAVRNYLSGPGNFEKYGSWNYITPTSGGIHYGIYSRVEKSDGFAGFFIGRVAIGTETEISSTPNLYILPPSRGTNNQIMQTDDSGNVSWVDETTLGTDDQTISYNVTTGQLDIENGNSVNLSIGDITTVTAGDGLTGGGTTGALTLDVVATNGLTANANNIVLGGTLTQDTNIIQGTYDLTLNLNSTGDFIVQDSGTNHFEVRDTGNTHIGGDTYWNDIDTSGTPIATLTDDGDDGRFRVFENGTASVDLDANSGFFFNEQGLDRDFRIESDDETNMFRVDAGNNRIGIMEATPNFDIHLKQSTRTEDGTGGMAFESNDTSNNWKIYHSGLHFSFSENGIRRGYIEGGTGNYIPTSDRRLKKSITEIESILDKVSQLKAYRYLYKDQELSAKKTIGFMAQDIQPFFPELVGQAEDGYFGLNYSGFGVVAIKAIQEQQVIIESQQRTIKELKESQDESKLLLSQLLKRIEDLESKN